MSQCRILLIAAALAVVGVLPARIAAADDFLTIDFPIVGKQTVPEGLAAPPRQVTTPEGIGYTEILLRKANKDEHIFVTFVFEEDGRSGPGVFWRGDSSDEQLTLSKDLAEGVEGLNRRTIPLPQSATAEPGRIYITGRQDHLLRVRIDWCTPQQTFVVYDQERPALIAAGSAHLERDLVGDDAMSPPDAWFGPILDASLQDGATNLSDPVEFVIPLDGPVASSRFRAKFLGLPLGKGVKVWVNGKRMGRMIPEAPGLTDPGYVRKDGKAVYAGWREGSVFIEPGTLKAGENSVILQATDKDVFIRGAAIEIEALPVIDEPVEKPDRPEVPGAEIAP